MSSLDESLRGLLSVEGVRTAALIDMATGMIVRSVGDQDANLPEAAASMAEEARAAQTAQGPTRPGGELEEITMLTPERLHLSRVLDSRPGEGLILFVDLDRARGGNIALSTLQIGRATPAVLA